jgi:hypothetical protein
MSFLSGHWSECEFGLYSEEMKSSSYSHQTAMRETGNTRRSSFPYGDFVGLAADLEHELSMVDISR